MKWLVLLFVALLVSACSVRPPAVADWEAQRENVRQLDQWELRGRIGINVEDDPDASGQGSIDWRQLNNSSLIRVSGPLGVGGWLLSWEPTKVMLSDKNGEHTLQYRGPDAAAQFVQDQLGWPFPADSLSYWLRCLAAPGAQTAAAEWGESGELRSFSQLGWQVSCQRYATFDNYIMPTRIRMEGNGVRLKLAVKDWRLSPQNWP